jgi:hypothetical protein
MTTETDQIDMSPLSDKEAVIAINGVLLAPSQSTALRVAVCHMLSDMQDPLALGDDEHGRFMVQAYKARLTEVLGFLFSHLT